jgi:hypothetical protein
MESFAEGNVLCKTNNPFLILGKFASSCVGLMAKCLEYVINVYNYKYSCTIE